MIELFQQSNGLIGSNEAIEDLKTKDHARILTISDSHGGYRIFSKIISRFGKNCDAMIFGGDGDKDLSEILEYANEDITFKECLPPVIALVRGNNDARIAALSFDISKYNQEVIDKALLKGSLLIPAKQLITVNGHNILITHGHLQGIDISFSSIINLTKEENCSTVIHGHTHIPYELNEDGIKIINPGSITQPRGGMPPAFAILTVEKDFIDTAFLRINNGRGEDDSYSIFKI